MELLIPIELRQKLLTQSDEAQKYVVYALNLCGHHTEELAQAVRIPVINLDMNTGASKTRSVRKDELFSCKPTSTDGIKCDKEFGKKFGQDLRK